MTYHSSQSNRERVARSGEYSLMSENHEIVVKRNLHLLEQAGIAADPDAIRLGGPAPETIAPEQPPAAVAPANVYQLNDDPLAAARREVQGSYDAPAA